MEKDYKHMIEKFQCPGCVNGSNTKCGSYIFDQKQLCCSSHICGTSLGLNNNIALGMPKGFNKAGFDENGKSNNKINIRFWIKGTHPEWDHLNIPVWAMEENGFLFVRTYAPRINYAWVDVIENGSLSLCENAINVKKFINEID